MDCFIFGNPTKISDEAIERGFAYYHPKTGDFTWREEDE